MTNLTRDPATISAAPQAEENSDYLVYGQIAEEVNASLRAGQTPDVEALAARHPEQAASIREMVNALVLLDQLGHPVEPGRGAAGAGSGPELGQLGDFRLLREVGRGGMGIVYEAEQISLRRRVALKVMPFAAALEAKQLQRFKNEAQAAAHLHHTNIVPVFAVGTDRGVHYYAMQFIDGQTLAALIHELREQARLNTTPDTVSHPAAAALAGDLASGRFAPTPPTPKSIPTTSEPTTTPAAALSTEHSASSPGYFRTVANLGAQAALALEYAHSLGVVHRDIKPANLLVDTRGNLWITDFGMAQVQGDAGLTMTGDLLGTIRYMSPEQASGKRLPLDHRTDIYSLGATLYELVTLHPAFPGHDRATVLRQIAVDEPVRPRRLNPGLPVDLETILLKAMEKNPAERYLTAGELADDLQRFLDDKPIRARRPTPAQWLRKWARRHRPLVAAAAVLLVLAVVGLAASTLLIMRERDQALVDRAEAQKQRALAYQALDELYTQVTERLIGDDYQRLGQPEKAESAYRQAIARLDKLAGDYPELPHYRLELASCFLSLGNLLQTVGRRDEADAAYQQAQEFLDKLAVQLPATAAVTEAVRERTTALKARTGHEEPAAPAPAPTAFFEPKQVITVEPVGKLNRSMQTAAAKGHPEGHPLLSFTPNASQAVSLREQVRSEKIANRQKMFDSWMYEHASMPAGSGQEVKIQLSKDEPPLTEICSGKALNCLLVEAQQASAKQATAGIVIQKLELKPDELSHLNVVRRDLAGRGAVLRHMDDLQWPISLRSAPFKGDCELVTSQAALAQKQLSKNKPVDDAVLTTMKQGVQHLQKQLRANVGDLPVSQYIEARRYLNQLEVTVTALEKPDAANYFNGTYRITARTVPELILQMEKNDLQFAPAAPGDEAAYVELHRALGSALPKGDQKDKKDK
jgi:serine/threonine protein kinase